MFGRLFSICRTEVHACVGLTPVPKLRRLYTHAIWRVKYRYQQTVFSLPTILYNIIIVESLCNSNRDISNIFILTFHHHVSRKIEMNYI